MQAATTFEVLKELGAEKHPMITVLNKVDACDKRLMVDRMRFTYPKTVELSATTGIGFDRLLERMIEEISLLRKRVHLRIPQSHYALVSELMSQGKVFSIDYAEDDVLLDVEIPSLLERKVAPWITHGSP
ncbi:MAG TPA: hypothetical protein VGM34_04200, partial [Chlamydiales bacterium]